MKQFHMSKKNLTSACVILLAVALLAAGGVFAKYLHTAKDDRSSVSSKMFYFESDYLTEDNHAYKLNAGTDSIAFTLYNYENSLRVSEVVSTYQITVTSENDASFTIDGEVATEKEISVEATKTDTKITLGSLDDGCSYQVTVIADGGYVKTLSARFEVAPAQTGFYMNVDNSDQSVLILTVWTEDVSGAIEISIPEGLVPDATDPVLKSVHNFENGAYLAIAFTDAESFATSYSSRTYRFFKTEGYDSTQKFTVTMGTITATESNIP